MTKQIKSGEMKGSIENLDQLKPGDGVVLDDKTKYEYGADLHSDGTPLIDPASGKAIVIRIFEFKINPDPKVRNNFPTNGQVIFNTHATQIKTILWGDGLRPLEEVFPRVIINLKGGKYQIFVLCEARLGIGFADKPKSLSSHLVNKNGTTRH